MGGRNRTRSLHRNRCIFPLLSKPFYRHWFAPYHARSAARGYNAIVGVSGLARRAVSSRQRRYRWRYSRAVLSDIGASISSRESPGALGRCGESAPRLAGPEPCLCKSGFPQTCGTLHNRFSGTSRGRQEDVNPKKPTYGAVARAFFI